MVHQIQHHDVPVWITVEEQPNQASCLFPVSADDIFKEFFQVFLEK
jgi:hypothetical protein